jgi:hypothetical protein
MSYIHGDPTDDAAALKMRPTTTPSAKHVEVIIVPLAGGPRERGSPEDEGLHLTASATLLLVFRRQVVAANVAINCLDDIVDDLCGF